MILGNWMYLLIISRYSPVRDDVILDCYRRGIVTGTSLLVCVSTFYAGYRLMAVLRNLQRRREKQLEYALDYI